MRLFIGNVADGVRDGDVKDFFRDYGDVHSITLRQGFGFVDIEDRRDAEDAMHDLDGKELLGMRVRLEPAGPRGPRPMMPRGGGDRYGPPPPRGYFGGPPPRRDFHHEDRYRPGPFRGGGGRFSPPRRTPYRLTVENLSTRCSWQDLKDYMREVGPVTYAEAHTVERNKGLVCFERHRDVQRAIDRYQGKDINGRKLELFDDSSPDRRRNLSRSPSRHSRSRHSRSRSLTPSSRGGSSIRSPPRNRSRSRKRSPDRHRHSSASVSPRSGGGNREKSRSSPVKREDSSH